jgi:esterase/lipase
MRPQGIVSLSLVGLGLASLGYFILLPPLTTDLAKEDAVPEDLAQVSPSAGSIELRHAEPVSETFVLLHGVTNNPEQFRLFGEMLYQSGANVFIPRMPFHGHRDRMTETQSHFSAAGALRATNTAIDHVRPWGGQITLVGLSVNGLPAAWVAMNRPDVRRCVLLAPFFSVHGMPDWLIAPAAQFFLRWPNFFVWWDNELQEKLGGDSLVYPRFATRTMASFLQFGREIFAQAREQTPLSSEVLVVTTESDQAINNARVAQLVNLWRQNGSTAVQTYEFPLDEEVPHDFIDPYQPDQQIDRVYPVLLQLLGRSSE